MHAETSPFPSANPEGYMTGKLVLYMSGCLISIQMFWAYIDLGNDIAFLIYNLSNKNNVCNWKPKN